jgi:ATP-dependent Clp protease ATP-binding subunit ClpC
VRLTLPVLVGADRRDRFHVRLATLQSREHAGPSLAEILDDLALDVMEAVPKASPAALARYGLCPDLQLRRVKVDADLPLRGAKPVPWKGRLSVVLERWPGDGVRIATVPRLGAVRFPIAAPAHLEAALVELLREQAPRHLDLSWLDAAVARHDEHLELIEVDVDLPTVLSSRKPPKKRKDRAPQDPTPPEARQWVPPVTLRSVAVSLGHRAIDGTLAPAFGRDALVDRIVRELRRPGAAVLLLGPSGVGKTAVVHEVVRRLVDPAASITERTDVWQLDGNRLIAGMSVVGAWERRVEQLVAELHARDDLLVVDDLPTLVWTGRSAQSDTHVAGFLEPHLARGELRILGECTSERLAAARDEAPGFFDRFRVFQVPPLDERETLLVALRIARALEADRPVRVAPEALTAVLAFTRRFQAHRCQPGAAVALLRRVVDETAPPVSEPGGGPPDVTGPARHVLDRGGALEAVARITGLPAFVLDAHHARPPDEVRAWFDYRVLAQPNAADAVVDVVCTLQQGLNDPHRPLATLLLAGPTGVGKTETAKALATWLFGDPSRLVRFDMSEFGGRDAAARLIGDVRRPEGELTRAVAQQPFAVVLFDEIEKAHPAIFDVLLQVTGEGRLTNAVGRTVDLTSTVVLLTSNLGVAEAGAAVGFGAPAPAAQDAHYAAAVAKFFRPEFVNRLDRVVAYRALEVQHVGALVERLVAQLLERRGLRRSGVLVDVDYEVVDYIVGRGFSSTYGARALKRTLESELTVPLARELVARPPAADVRIEVYPRSVGGADPGERLELKVEPLVRAPEPPGAEPPPADLRGLRALHAAVAERHRALLASGTWRRAEERRTELVAEAQRGDVDGWGWVFELVSRGVEVGRRLDELAERLETSYDETVEVEVYRERPNPRRKWMIERHKLVTVHQPVPVDPVAASAVGPELRRIDLTLTELGYLARYLDAPDDPVLVRVLAATPDSHAYARDVARALGAAWADWGATVWLVRRLGDWRLEQEYLKSEDNAYDTLHALDGYGLSVRVPGLRRLVEALEGYALTSATRGPDTVAHLARIDLLPSSDLPPLEQLEQDDLAWDAWRDARRLGEDPGPCPRPGREVTLGALSGDVVLMRLLSRVPPVIPAPGEGDR